MFENVLAEQNPHWTGAIYPQGIDREFFKQLLNYLKAPQIISITGVRRAGKSTLLKQTINFLIREGVQRALTKGILVTTDIEKEWLVDGITIRAIPLYQFILET